MTRKKTKSKTSYDRKALLKEISDAHLALDALDLPKGPLIERLFTYESQWLKKVGEASQTQIGIDARKLIRAIRAIKEGRV